MNGISTTKTIQEIVLYAFVLRRVQMNRHTMVCWCCCAAACWRWQQSQRALWFVRQFFAFKCIYVHQANNNNNYDCTMYINSKWLDNALSFITIDWIRVETGKNVYILFVHGTFNFFIIFILFMGFSIFFLEKLNYFYVFKIFWLCLYNGNVKKKN